MSRPEKVDLSLQVKETGVAGHAVRALAMKVHREHVYSGKKGMIEHDQRSFRAFFTYQRGWDKPDIDKLWKHIEDYATIVI